MRIRTFCALAVTAAALATPALAAPSGAEADSLVPAGAKAPMDGYAGRPWIKALGYCGGLYVERSDFLKPTDIKAAAAMRQKAAPFLAAAAIRIERDRKISNDEAFKVAIGEINKGRMIVQALMNAQIDAHFAEEDVHCAAIYKAEQAAGS